MNQGAHLQNLIIENLNQIKLLRLEPTVDLGLIDDLLWKVLGYTLELDEIYAKALKEVNDKQVVTIKDELFKRQAMVEISDHREAALSKIFDRSNEDQKLLAGLFEDMRKQVQHTTTFYKSDVKLVQDQLDAIKIANDRVDNLNAEKQEIQNKLDNINSGTYPYQELSEQINRDYDKFLANNHVEPMTLGDTENLKEEQKLRLLWKSTITRNIELAKKANISIDEYNEFMITNDQGLRDINEKLFLYELSIMFKEPTNSYEELLDKSQRIYRYVVDYELNNYNANDIKFSNKLAYRTLAFESDVRSIEKHIKAPLRISELETRLKEINIEIEHAYDHIKGKKQLNDIINNREEEYPQVNNLENDDFLNQDFKNIRLSGDIAHDFVMEEQRNKQLAENGLIPLSYKDTQLESLNIPLTLPLLYGEFEVIGIKKASPKLLGKVKKYKEQLLSIGKKVAAVILAGTILALSGSGIATNNSIIMENVAEDSIVTTIDNNAVTSFNQEIDIDKNEEAISPTIGDKVHLSKGVKYYRDSKSAQQEQNVYEVGKNTLREGNYNVNRIALLSKDANGNPTGDIITVNTTLGVSAEDIAKSLGLQENQYDVIIHIGGGDEQGNYIQANINEPSVDDICWIKTDGTYSNGLSLTKAASDILERGMNR